MANGITPNNAAFWAKQFEKLNKHTPDSLYLHTGGEAEARLTENRSDLSGMLRRLIFPWNKGYFKDKTGVPLDDLEFYGKDRWQTPSFW